MKKKVTTEKCVWCGKPGRFATWQFYNIDTRKHEFCVWCSEQCLCEAEGSETKISNINRGKFHLHKGNNTCLGELNLSDFPLRRRKKKSMFGVSPELPKFERNEEDFRQDKNESVGCREVGQILIKRCRMWHHNTSRILPAKTNTLKRW